jgi:hypothetical protein
MAVQTWERVAPLFALSGTKCEVVKTKSVGHAFNMMDQASESDLQSWDGIVVVGGDGLFNEVLNGLLIGRHYAPPPVVPQRSVSAEETAREQGGQSRASDQVRFSLCQTRRFSSDGFLISSARCVWAAGGALPARCHLPCCRGVCR